MSSFAHSDAYTSPADLVKFDWSDEVSSAQFILDHVELVKLFIDDDDIEVTQRTVARIRKRVVKEVRIRLLEENERLRGSPSRRPMAVTTVSSPARSQQIGPCEFVASSRTKATTRYEERRMTCKSVP